MRKARHITLWLALLIACLSSAVALAEGPSGGWGIPARQRVSDMLSVGSETEKLGSALTVRARPDETLTGTTTVNASTTVTGVGTRFKEQLGVGDRISVSSAATTYRTIKSITSNTELEVDGNLGDGSTQTISAKHAIWRMMDSSGAVIGLQNDLGLANTGLVIPGTSLATLISNIGSTNATVRISSTQTVSDDLTIPANVSLQIEQGGSLSVASAKTVTINGPFSAPLTQVFSGAGSVVFGTRREVYPEWLGVDGTADEVQINAASVSLSVGGTVILSGSYDIDAAVTPASDTGLKTKTAAEITSDDNIHMIQVSGSLVSDNLAADAIQGAEAITVTTPASFTIGDYVALYNGRGTNTNIEGDPGPKYELGRVKDKVGAILTLESPLVYNYLVSDTAVVRRFDAKYGIEVSGIKITSNAAAAVTKAAIYIENARDITLDNNQIEAGNYIRGINIRTTYGSKITRNLIKNTKGSFAIGIYFGSNNNIVSENHIFNHDEASGGDAAILLYYGSDSNAISGNTINGSGTGGIYVHTKSSNNSISANTLTAIKGGSSASALGGVFGAWGNTWTGNTVIGANIGVSLLNTRYETFTGNTLKRCNNLVDDHGYLIRDSFDWQIIGGEVGWCDEGIKITQVSTAGARGKIIGVSIHDCDAYGILVDSFTDLDVIGNHSYNNALNGIHITTNVSNLNVTDNMAIANAVGLYIQAQRATITGNHLKSNTSHGLVIYDSTSYGSYIAGNIITGNGGWGVSNTGGNSNNMKHNWQGNALFNNQSGSWQFPASTAPTVGTWAKGMIATYQEPAAAGTWGVVCTTEGTFSAATDSAGDTDGSTAVISGMDDTSDFFAGEFVTVSAGFPTTGPYQILSKTASSITINVNSNSSQTDITVDTPNPVFKTFAAIGS